MTFWILNHGPDFKPKVSTSLSQQAGSLSVPIDYYNFNMNELTGEVKLNCLETVYYTITSSNNRQSDIIYHLNQRVYCVSQVPNCTCSIK